jgi:hypothetical protein
MCIGIYVFLIGLPPDSRFFVLIATIPCQARLSLHTLSSERWLIQAAPVSLNRTPNNCHDPSSDQLQSQHPSYATRWETLCATAGGRNFSSD